MKLLKKFLLEPLIPITFVCQLIAIPPGLVDSLGSLCYSQNILYFLISEKRTSEQFPLVRLSKINENYIFLGQLFYRLALQI